jgi:putative ABC transport system permease protein
MFFTYLGRELRRRARQAFVIALGLALGIGLTITVTAASAGVRDAQGQVLRSLYGVGTDMTVTQTAARGSGGPQRFSFTGPSAGTTTGTKSATSAHDNLNLAPGSSAIADGTLTEIKGLSGVSGAVGSLTLTDFKVDTTITQKVTQGSSSGGSGAGRPGGAGGGGGPGFGGPAGGNGSFNVETVTGVDTSDLAAGPLSASGVTSGRALAADDASAHVAVVNASYASSNSLTVGSTLTLAGTKFTVVGLLPSSASSDVFIPLPVAQKLSGQTGKVSTIYVTAGNSTEIDAVAASIKAHVSGATVTTSADLAKTVSGSLASTASLADNLGRWLSIAVLAAAFALAALLTVAAVGRRVREFGTLKALGWTSRRVVRQVVGEAMVLGLIGGALGIALGYAGAAAIDAFAPSLTASTAGVTGPTGSGLPGGFGGPGGGSGFAGARPTGTGASVAVHLAAPVALDVLALAVGLAVLGGLVAGAFGGWRASSLRPADALRKV